MPTRLMDSAPPPITRSFCPLMIWAAAKFTASRPEAQKRLICTPGTFSPSPALIAAKRAMSLPASHNGESLVISSGNFTGPGMSQNIEASLFLEDAHVQQMGFSWKNLTDNFFKQNWDIYE